MGDVGMSEQGPVCAPDVAKGQRGIPVPGDFSGFLRLGQVLNGGFVFAIQHLVNQTAGKNGFASSRNEGAVDVVTNLSDAA